MEMTETGLTVFKRTYSRDGETWPETVRRVVDGNIGLVPNAHLLPNEREDLVRMMQDGRIIPAGRQLYMSGVDGRQFLYNCHVSGWSERLSDHFTFTFLRLMEGGGVGANYSTHNFRKYRVDNLVRVYLVCDESHPDYEELKPYLSQRSDVNPEVMIDDSREGWAYALGLVIDCASGWRRSFNSVTDDEVGITTYYLTFNLSQIRPSGSPIKTFGGTAAGPVPLAKLLKATEELMNCMWHDEVNYFYAMKLDHEISECVISGNVRRSARMSIMHWDDTFIMEFINMKQSTGDHWSTNISVEIDDEFVSYIKDNSSPESESDIQRRNKARNVYRNICEGMLKNGEPGIWNSSLSNVGEIKRVAATNPCGEIPLCEWEACNLGHINLAAFVDDNGNVNYGDLYYAHVLVARFLIRSTFGDANDIKQRDIMDANRRIGVGHLGFQWFINRQGMKYSDSYKYADVVNFLRNAASLVKSTSMEYSFALRIPAPIKVTTVAPTGTIAKMFGVSEGIHPIYAKYFIRRIRFSSVDPDQLAQVEEFRRNGYSVYDDIYSANTLVVDIPTKDPIIDFVSDTSVVESANEISVHDMLSVQAMYQELYADNAVSFTVNIPEGTMTPEELSEILKPFLGQLKGTTVMVDGTRPMAPYERLTEDDYFEYKDYLDVMADSSGDGGCARGACPVR